MKMVKVKLEERRAFCFMYTVPNRIGCYLFQIGLFDAVCARSQIEGCPQISVDKQPQSG